MSQVVFHYLVIRPWYSLFTYNVNEIILDWVRDCYYNMKIDGGMFTPYVCGKTSEVSSAIIGEFLDIEDLEEHDYPLPDDENELVEPIDYDYLAFTLCVNHHD